jgi:hypothetical protein
MQAAQIKTKREYAVSHDGKLVRFYVDAVMSVRVDGQKNVPSVIQGRFIDSMGTSVLLPVDRILGPYEEHVELVEQKRAAEAEAKRAKEEKDAKIARVTAALTALLGVPVQGNGYSYSIPAGEHTDTLEARLKAINGFVDAAQ